MRLWIAVGIQSGIAPGTLTMPLHFNPRGLAVAILLSGFLASPPQAAAQSGGPVADAAVDPAPFYPERRKSQFPEGFGYALFPYPYSLPGLGSGLSLVGGAMNVADTYTDAYGIVFGGDVKGAAAGVADIHLMPRRLILELGYGRINKASIQSYSQRGMGTGKNDYRLVEFGESEFYGGRLTATFLDRRAELYGAWWGSAARLKAVRDKDGGLIVEAGNAPRDRGHTVIAGVRGDFTDDYADPRRGVRFDISRTASPPNRTGADYFVMDYSATAYLPIGKRSTWAFNAFRSDAVVRSQGLTDPAALESDAGLPCSSLADPVQKGFCDEVIANMAAANRFGTATQLGGFSRLRGYPQGRFKGAHTVFLGTEFRWNLNEEHKPFDIFVMKDVRTLVQLAFFYETGVASDERGDLGDRHKYRDTVGTGLRVVTASCVVFRGDVGFTRDGPGVAMFIGYPWELQ
jgi:hypothetical protein